MNLVGKILVWVIMMMSLVFMAFTITVYATQHNWMVKATEFKAERDKAKGTSASLSAEKAELEKLHAEYIVIRQQEFEKLEAENENYKAAIAKLDADANRLNTDTASAVSTLAAVHANLAKDRGEIEALRVAFDKSMLDRTKLLQDVIDANDQAQAFSLNYATLMETNRQLSKDLANALSVLNTLGETPSPERYTNIAPPVIGQITEVRPSGMVEISLGSDSGLVAGHRLHVYHDDVYLGQIEVTITEPDRAAAKILPEFRTGTIQRGDHVASKLN